MATPTRGRGRPHNANDGNKSDNGQREFFAAMTNMANTIQAGMIAMNVAHAQHVGGGNGGVPADHRPMNVASFLKINPPLFPGSANPTEETIGFRRWRGLFWHSSLELVEGNPPVVATTGWQLHSYMGNVQRGVLSEVFLESVRGNREIELMYLRQGAPESYEI
ncbi:hypothetical protein PIB30_067250 [Stylosanthes scabra]|uniref:Uncharacterized protein n=1 Tax=Stylosanthes scabra TaxID=79078 RepID=A0ABU6RMY6_9FABA|nr:hypothetical protein [Stylosanthes scabra]